MKRRWIALLCATALCLALFLPGVDAVGGTVFQLALNDQFADEDAINPATMPVLVGGAVYIPYSTFDWRTTGVNLGVFYGKDGGLLTLYNKDKRLMFDVDSGTCQDGDGAQHEMRAVMRNGKIYVPASAVCTFFGLFYYYGATDDCGVLIRISNRNAVLSDSKFLGAALSSMRGRYVKYMQAQNSSTPPTPPPEQSARPTASPTPSRPITNTVVPDRRAVRVYLAFRSGNASRAILKRLSHSGVSALFLIRPEELAASGDEIRALVGAGHAVGLLVSGETADEAEAALNAGNDLLARIVWMRAHTALVEGGSAEVLSELERRGWRCWRENVDGLPTGESAAENADRILNAVEAKRSLAWVTMDCSTASADALPLVLSRLREENYTIRLAVETEL